MIRFFVSSTFNDMHIERDTLAKIVFAKANQYADIYGERIAFSDLRWGINTAGLDEIEAGNKIINYCIEEIDKCKPYMIVILGDRYGTSMENGLVKGITERHGLDYRDNLSVTEIEILAGEKYIGLDRILFYFRRIEGDYPKEIYEDKYDKEKAKLDSLKDRIRESGARVGEYTVSWNEETGSIDSLGGFIDIISRDIMEIIDCEVKGKSPEQLLVENIAETSYVDDIFIDKVKDCLIHNDVIVLYGKELSGKTTVAANLVSRVNEIWDYEVCPIFTSVTLLPDSDDDIKQYVCERIRNRAGVIDKSILFVVDGIDTLVDQISERGIVEAIIGCFKEIEETFETEDRLIISSSNQSYPGSIRVLDTESILGSDSVKGIQNKLLSGKELGDSIKDCLVDKCLGKQPLYEKLLIQRLDMMTADDYRRIRKYEEENNVLPIEAITTIQKQIILESPDELLEMAFSTCWEYSFMFDPEYIHKSLWTVANSLYGFRVEELAEIIGKKDKENDLLVYYLSACKYIFVSKSDGRIDFASSKFKSYFYKRISERMDPSEDDAIQNNVWSMFCNGRLNDQDEWTFWMLKEYRNESILERFIGLSRNARTKMLSLLEDQNTIEKIESEEEINSKNAVWANNISVFMNTELMTKKMIDNYLKMIFEIVDEHSVYRLINCAYLIKELQGIIKQKIERMKRAVEMGLPDFAHSWKSVYEQTLFIQSKIYEFLQLNHQYIDDELNNCRKETSEYYSDDPRTIINEISILIQRELSQSNYEKLIDLAKELSTFANNINEDINAAWNAALGIGLIGDIAVQKQQFEKAFELYKQAFPFWTICIDNGDDSWETYKEFGFLYYKMALCMQKQDEPDNCVDKFLSNAQQWLKDAYDRCDSENYADAIAKILNEIKVRRATLLD